ncbi:hypothetical protein B296_00020773 [Ensete ventricosum]|uniref:Uncharacterized protein n=1 Tax=Ensete ventricosum TaxID=4639 RepID=A0A427ACQ7_ENSVE|nr:hypothetical protein B296_00020773 [Ensete ventricosum]
MRDPSKTNLSGPILNRTPASVAPGWLQLVVPTVLDRPIADVDALTDECPPPGDGTRLCVPPLVHRAFKSHDRRHPRRASSAQVGAASVHPSAWATPGAGDHRGWGSASPTAMADEPRAPRVEPTTARGTLHSGCRLRAPRQGTRTPLPHEPRNSFRHARCLVTNHSRWFALAGKRGTHWWATLNSNKSFNEGRGPNSRKGRGPMPA